MILEAQAPSPAHSMDGHYYRRKLPHLDHRRLPHFVTFCTKDRRKLDVALRDIVLNVCVRENSSRINLHLAVVMPDHVHLVFTRRANGSGDLIAQAEILQSIKSASAHAVNRHLGAKGRVWQSESFDRLLRDGEDVNKKLEYVFNNPVRAGLVRHAFEYRWTWVEESELFRNARAEYSVYLERRKRRAGEGACASNQEDG